MSSTSHSWTPRLSRLCAGLLVSMVSVAAMAQPVPDAGPPPMRHAMGHPGSMGPMLGGRLLDQVGATADQKARIRDIFEAARTDLRAQHDTQRGLRQQLAQLMAAPQLDAAAAEVLRQQMLAAHDLSSRRMMQARLDASAVLTAEQRAQLAQRMAQRRGMMERHRQERRALDAPQG